MIRKWSMPFVKMTTIHAQMKKKWLSLARVEEFLMTELWSDLGLKDSRRWMCSSVGSILDSRAKTNQVMQKKKKLYSGELKLVIIWLQWRLNEEITKLDRQTGNEPDHARLQISAEALNFIFLAKEFFGDFTKEEWYFRVRFKGNWISM